MLALYTDPEEGMLLIDLGFVVCEEEEEVFRGSCMHLVSFVIRALVHIRAGCPQ
jgi:hypothetical protein